MRVIGIVVLTLLISFLLFIASVYITFKYILTPERIKNYVKSYIERTVSEQFEKQKKEILDKISLSNLIGRSYVGNESRISDLDKEIEDIEILESVDGNVLNTKITDTGFLNQFEDVNMLASKVANMDMLNGLSDVNMLASKMFNNANMKIESLKYKITEYFSNKNEKEE